MNDFLKLIKLISTEAEKLKLEDKNEFYTTNNIHNAIIKFVPKITKLEENAYECYRKNLISGVKYQLPIEKIIELILIKTYKEC